MMKHETWKNWYKNQSCLAYVVDAKSEADICEAVAFANKKGLKVRVAGTGHSNVALIPNPGVVIVTDNLAGIVAHDLDAETVTLWAGTKICNIGDPLWERGLSLSNQGDVDTQSIAGAISTGTHGTGLALPNLSSRVQSFRMVTASGDVQTIDASDPEKLKAARVSLGLLGIVTQLTMKVSKAYHLHEWVGVMPYEVAAAAESEMVAKFRHFGYFWCSSPASANWLGVPAESEPEKYTDCAYVRIFHPEPIDVGALSKYEHRRRYDRSYRIFPEVYTPDFHEMEFMVPLEDGQKCFRELRSSVRHLFDKVVIPGEMRFTAGDDSYLSEYYGGPRVAISVSGRMHKDDYDFLNACEDIFRKYDGRTHWGKVNRMTREDLQRTYPRHGDFVAIRREMDPNDVFLNDYLAPLFG